MKLLVVKLTEAQLKGLDELIKTGIYQNKSTAIREAIRDLLNSELVELAPALQSTGSSSPSRKSSKY